MRDDARTATERFNRILLATEGRKIPDAAIARVIELADPAGATAHVFSIARVHGVSFGLQSPGLMPNKRELADARENVKRAVKRLKRKGIEAEGHILATRKSTKRICEEACQGGVRGDRHGRRPGSEPVGQRLPLGAGTPAGPPAARRSRCSWSSRTDPVVSRDSVVRVRFAAGPAKGAPKRVGPAFRAGKPDPAAGTVRNAAPEPA